MAGCADLCRYLLFAMLHLRISAADHKSAMLYYTAYKPIIYSSYIITVVGMIFTSLTVTFVLWIKTEKKAVRDGIT